MNNQEESLLGLEQLDFIIIVGGKKKGDELFKNVEEPGELLGWEGRRSIYQKRECIS